MILDPVLLFKVTALMPALVNCLVSSGQGVQLYIFSDNIHVRTFL